MKADIVRVVVGIVEASWNAGAVTTAMFWSCSCGDEYIHSCRQDICEKCGDSRHCSPDVRLEDAIEHLIRQACEDPRNDIVIRTVQRRRK